MNFKDKYTSETESAKSGKKEKIVLTDDAYAIGEAIVELTEELHKARTS